MSVNSEIKTTFEYYFSHENFRTDKFLQNESLKNNGWIDAEIILKFNKMRILNANLTDFDQIVRSLTDLVEFKYVQKNDISDQQAEKEKQIPEEIKTEEKEKINKTEEKEQQNKNDEEESIIKTEQKEEQNKNNEEESKKESKIKTKQNKSHPSCTPFILQYTEEDSNLWCLDFDSEKKLLIRKKMSKEFAEYILDQNIDRRILNIKGFDISMSLDGIKAYLSNYFDLKTIRLIRDKNGVSLGRIVCEVLNEESAQKIVKMLIPVPNNNSDVETEYLSKKIKKEEDGNVSIQNFLSISTKDASNKAFRKKSAHEHYIHKYYRYTSNLTEVKDIKSVVVDAAFVDAKNNILRFKNDCDFQEKEIKSDINKVKLTKLTEQEVKEYIEENKLFSNEKKSMPKKKKFFNKNKR